MFLLIDRYISKLFLAYFLAGCLVFVTLFISVDFISTMVRFKTTTDILAQYYFYLAPGLLYQMLPVACLMGTVFTLSTMNKNNELVALFSSGMSLARISSPILLWVVLISGVGFWFNDRLGPHFSQKKSYLYFNVIKKQPGLYSTVRTNKIWYRSNDVIFNIKTLQPEQKAAQGLSMYYFNKNWDLIEMVSADRVQFENQTWLLSEGAVTLFLPDSPAPVTQRFKDKRIIMGEDVSDLQSTNQASDSMGLTELKRFISRNKEAGLDTLRYEVDFHAKFGFALAAFVMSFLGIPFSITRQRSGGAAVNIAMCIGVAFLYWLLYSSGIAVGRHGLIPPFLAAWVPNVAMFTCSVFLLVRMRR